MITYRLRIQSDSTTFYGENYRPEELSRLLAEAEGLISDGLPEGWYAKIEDAPGEQPHAIDCDMDEDCLERDIIQPDFYS